LSSTSPPMPAFGDLSEDQIADVVAYVASCQPGEG
jgi:mono/diheme cytochrome c family protein